LNRGRIERNIVAFSNVPMKQCAWFVAAVLSLAVASPGFAEVQVAVERNGPGEANGSFRFKRIPPPHPSDAATRARFTLVSGERDRNGGDVAQLHDGRWPRDEDAPSQNFFFAPGSNGGRIQIDLGTNVVVRQVNTYSWHANTRGPQVYHLYASAGVEAAFQVAPARGIDPESCGWQLLARVDTRKEGEPGGQHAASISDSSGSLGQFRYLLFDAFQTESNDPFGNTFYSEIDVIHPGTAAPLAVSDELKPVISRFEADGGKYRFTIDATVAPDLMPWAENELRPVVQEWYPKLVAMLPSDGFVARTNVTIRFRDNMRGTPASAGGGYINCNAGWFRRELKREALGSVVHEMVHVVQNYSRMTDANYQRVPRWLVEGIPDYIRWFLYEPQTKGAEITKGNLPRASYDASYRITGNFLNWVTTRYDSNIVRTLNAAGRSGRYHDDLWKKHTGKTIQELGAAWRKMHEERLAAGAKGQDERRPAAP
jgi:hypothetical protein